MRTLFCGTILLCTCAFAQSLLTNEVVLQMVKAGVSNEVILTMVSEKPSQFSLAAADLIVLKQAGVSDKVIAAMLSLGRITSVSPAIPNPALVLHDGTPVRLRLTRNL